MSRWIWGWLVVVGCAAEGVRAEPPRYAAVWVDGSRSAGDEVQDWQRVDMQPALAGRKLFDPKSPFRTLLDTRLPVDDPAGPFVEFVGGDRLPGRVVGYDDGSGGTSDAGDAPPNWPHLLVETPLDFDLPGIAGRTRLRVMVERVRRVVGAASAQSNSGPSTLRHVDGRVLAFRALRWRADGAELLLETGLQRIAFEEIGDLHLSRAAEWPALFGELAALSPGLKSRLMRIETVGGARLTTSVERLVPVLMGGDAPEHWLHIVQPVWSLEPLGVGHRRIRSRACFAPHEIPLSRLTPNESRHTGTLSAGWSLSQTDRNVQGGALRNGKQEYAWGFGVHARHELQFDLPAIARAFRARVGLDELAGRGGAALGQVLVNGKQQFVSPLLLGGGQHADAGPIALGPRATRLELVADMANGAGPPGTDPFDVRDIVDWLEPIVDLDRTALATEVERAAPAALAGLAGWHIEPETGGAWRLAGKFDSDDRTAPRFRLLMQLSAPITLTRREQITASHRAAVLWLTRPRLDSGQPTFEVSLDGRRLDREPIPQLGDQGEIRPIVVDLAHYPEGEIEFLVRIDPQGHPATIDWRGMSWREALEQK